MISRDGDDTIFGGPGFDRLVGFRAADMFAFEPGSGLGLVFDFENRTDFLDVAIFRFNALSRDIMPSINIISGKAMIDFADGGRVELAGLAQEDLET